jgi:hypothetical protein
MTMEEVPIISETEREELIASLKEGQARIAAGKCAPLDPNTLVDRLMAVRATARRKKAK